MTNLPAPLASDAEREQAVVHLREHAAAGRLTLEEFTDRVSAAYAARTTTELAELERDLPVESAPSRRRPTRLLLGLFTSTVRDGRLRIPRRVCCAVSFGNVDLDLRRATLDSDLTTVFAFAAFGAIDVYVPEGVEVDLHGAALFGHQRARGDDEAARAGAPLVRVIAVSLFAGIDVWRVPHAWTTRTLREVIRGIRKGEHRELTA